MLPQEGISWSNQSAQAGTGLGCGPGFCFDSIHLDPDWQKGNAGKWLPAEPGELPATSEGNYVAHERHYLKPALLEGQTRQPWNKAAVRYAAHEDLLHDPWRSVDEKQNNPGLQDQLMKLLQGETLTIAPRQTVRAILDLGDYVCQYTTLVLAGGQGAVLRLRYAESLWDSAEKWPSGNRDVIGGKVFRGLADEYRADGRAHVLGAPWWRAGRYVQLEIRTAEDELAIRELSFEETRHAMGEEFSLQSNIPGVEEVARVALRTLRMCCHETHMDCPYYEQLQYVGDTRLQVLLSFYLDPVVRLGRKALRLMENSRHNASGLTLDSAPGEGKLIPPFALWWVAMLADYASWRGDAELLKDLLPGAREVLEKFLNMRDPQGLLVSGRGWNYVDNVRGFPYGVPPGGQIGGRSAVLHLQVVYTLLQLAKVEEFCGSHDHAQYWRQCAGEMFAVAEKLYWNTGRQLFADDPEHKSFSQHAQVLAVLTGFLKPDRARQIMAQTTADPGLIQCNIYFTHYLFEATAQFDGGAYLRRRLADWQALIAQGYKTFPEHFGATRSECHAWSAHVLYHILYTIAGIKPVGPAGQNLKIAPSLQPGEWIKAVVAHPEGMFRIDLNMDKHLEGTVHLPPGMASSSVLADDGIKIPSSGAAAPGDPVPERRLGRK